MVMLLLIVESLLIRKSLSKISLRILVSGTRGKSTVVKYIHAGLSSGNRKVLAKVTGEIPTLILPGGQKEEIHRSGRARIQEQFRTIRKAASLKVDGLVLECMAIDPKLQRTVTRFFHPDIFILTNIRDDHQEKMGRTRDKQAGNFLKNLPPESHILTADQRFSDQIKGIANTHKSKFSMPVALTSEEEELIPGYIFQPNVALALSACLLANIPRQTAFDAILEWIHEEVPDWNTMVPPIQISDRFINAFSVNDPESLNDFLHKSLPEFRPGKKIRLIFNTRRDRPLRTKIFCQWIRENQQKIQSVFFTGDHALYGFRVLFALRKKMELRVIYRYRFDRDFRETIRNAPPGEAFVGIGNIAGIGYRIIEEFKRKI